MARQLSPEKRAQFLSSALKLFVMNGVKNTSTAAIAKDAGTASGTLFLYFPTKQALIDALVLEISRSQSDTIISRLDKHLSAQEMFNMIWEGSIRWFMEHRDAYQYIQQVRDTAMISDEIVQKTSELFSFYYEAIEKGFDEGAIKAYPLELIGELLYRDIVAVMNLILAQPDQIQQESYLQLGFDIFWDGIKV